MLVNGVVGQSAFLIFYRNRIYKGLTFVQRLNLCVRLIYFENFIYCSVMTIAIKVEKREEKTSVKALRKAGKMPAVYYSCKQKSTPISVLAVEHTKV